MFEMSLDDVRMKGILDTLTSAGIVPFNTLTGLPKVSKFNMQCHREYSAADCKAAQYLTPVPEVNFDAGGKPGEIYLPSHTNEPIANAYALGIVVSTDLRRKMESAALTGLTFLPVGDERGRKSTVDYWELGSSISMPPLSPSMALHMENHLPHNGDPNETIYVKEGWDLPRVLFSPVELRYRKSDVENIGQFDIAHTQEALYRVRVRHVIVSQRFYEFCTMHELKIKWNMVHLEQD